jgi:hypothetical protein
MTPEQLRLASHVRSIEGLARHAAKLRSRDEVIDIDTLLADVLWHTTALLRALDGDPPDLASEAEF